MNFNENYQTNSYCSSANLLFSIENSFNDQMNSINKKRPRYLHQYSINRSNSKNQFQRSNTFHLLPNVSGKRLQVFISNQKNS